MCDGTAVDGEAASMLLGQSREVLTEADSLLLARFGTRR